MAGAFDRAYRPPASADCSAPLAVTDAALTILYSIGKKLLGTIAAFRGLDRIIAPGR